MNAYTQNGAPKMIIKLRIGNFRITGTIAKVIDVLGVNSKLPDGNHILMWDFDNQEVDIIIDSLMFVQCLFDLPQIYILKSSEPNNYIAYCFKKCAFRQAIGILGMTSKLDLNFYKWGIFRKRWTLRVGAKAKVKPKLVMILKSRWTEDCTIEELRSWVIYETLDMHHKQTIIKIGEEYDAKN